MRVGPGRNYEVDWLYVRKGLPMEIIQEFDNWRKVRDPHGNEGWIIHSLLAGERIVIIAPWEIPSDQSEATNSDVPTVDMHINPDGSTDVVARVEAGTLAQVNFCANSWCNLTANGANSVDIGGFVSQSQLWGVYPDEVLKR